MPVCQNPPAAYNPVSLLTIVYALLFYIATLVLVLGLGFKIRQYATTPAAKVIPTTPAPTTVIGVVWRMLLEVVCFTSLFKANKWIWFFGWVFHAGLILVLLRHLRYFTEPVWAWVYQIQPVAAFASYAVLGSLCALWARRFLIDRMRYISSPSDHLMLVHLIAIVLTGMAMKYLAYPDVVAVKAFFIGLMRFDWQPMPAHWLLNLHLALVALLMIIFPFSKLLHAPGVFFSPTRNQVDNPREAAR